MTKFFINNINDLIENQRATYYDFILFKINNEILKLQNPFLINLKNKLFLIYLYPNSIKIIGPKYSINQCILQNKTYSFKLYILVHFQVIINKKLHIFKQYVLLGEIPLITEEGTFIINGYEKIVINQVIKSDSIYFKKELNLNNKLFFSATLSTINNVIIKFILEDNFNFYFTISNFKDNKFYTLNLFDIFYFFNLNFKTFFDLFLNNEFFYKNYNFNKTFTNLDIYQNLEDNFYIGESGRYKLNECLNLTLPKNIHILTIYDFIKIIEKLIFFKNNNFLDDNIDDLKFKKINSIGNFLESYFQFGLYRIQQSLLNTFTIFKNKKTIFENLKKNNIFLKSNYFLNILTLLKKKFNKLINTKKVSFLIKEKKFNFNNIKIKFFLYNYFLNNKIFDPKILTNSIKEFLNVSELSQFMDQINPLSELYHKRKVSFITNNLANPSSSLRDIHLSYFGRFCSIETPEGQNAGLISSFAITNRINFYGMASTPYIIKENNKYFNNKNITFLNSYQEIKIPIGFFQNNLNENKNISVKKDTLFFLKNLKEIFFLNALSIQHLSVSTNLIPFLEHNDANRSIMGSNMQRQAVSLLYTQKPIVGTGLETIAILDSTMIIKSYSEGIVSYVSSEKIIIKDFNNNFITYFLKKFYNSNQKVAIIQKPIVWAGEKVFSGQIIADGPNTKDGELALGQNLTIAYMPWDGYNFEDAIIINEKLIINNLFVSLHIQEYNLNITENSYIYNYSKNNFLHKNGLIKIGSYIKPSSIVVELIKLNEIFNFEENLIINNLFYHNNNKLYNIFSISIPKEFEGCVIDIKLINNDKKNEQNEISITLKIFIAQIKNLNLGDKLSGRHGNKGIISKIVLNSDMPFLPNGKAIDIIFNPLGVPSRMNVGQIFEALLGLTGEFLGKRYKIMPFDEIYGKNSSRILINQKLKEVILKTKNKWLFNPYSLGKILIRDGRTGDYFDNPITIGKSYILKLIHLVTDKITARSIGPYSKIFEQPIENNSKSIGQRFGEMEVWTLEAYGCSNTLQELLTIKSDDMFSKNQILNNIIFDYNLPNSSIPESFLILLRELNSLGLDLSFKKFENNFSSTINVNYNEKNLFKEIEKNLELI